MHDTTNLEERGLPTVFVASRVFADAAQAQARALGSNPAAVFVDHPIQDRTDEEVRALADGAVAEITAKLVSS